MADLLRGVKEEIFFYVPDFYINKLAIEYKPVWKKDEISFGASKT